MKNETKTPRSTKHASFQKRDGGQSSISSSSAWDKAVKQWQEELPKKPSIFKPSGKLTFRAFVLMMIGAVVGVPAGACIGAIGGSISLVSGPVVIVVRNTLTTWAEAIGGPAGELIGGIFFGTVAALVFFGIIVIVLYLCGTIPAFIVFAAGKRANNQNPKVASVIATISALPSVAGGFYLMSYLFGGPATFEVPPVWVLVILGLVPAGVALIKANKYVVEAKFCQHCQEYMGMVPNLITLSYEASKYVVTALSSEASPEFEDPRLSETGTTGKPVLFKCTDCGSGILDFKVSFSTKWSDSGNQQERSASWLAGSWQLPPEQTKRIEQVWSQRDARTDSEGHKDEK